MKKILTLTFVILAFAIFVACANEGDGDTPQETTQAIAEATTESAAEITTEAATQVEETTEVDAPAISDGLVGNWDWMGMPYYTFNADGTGQAAGMDILWTSANGILSICTTPDICGTERCIAPAEWRYTIVGNNLSLVSTLSADLAFEYTRR